jgi:hypothetical protein
MSPLDFSFRHPKVSMPIWARFPIFVAGAAVCAVSVAAELTLDSFASADHVCAFLGIWFGVLSILWALAGPWIRTDSDDLLEE